MKTGFMKILFLMVLCGTLGGFMVAGGPVKGPKPGGAVVVLGVQGDGS